MREREGPIKARVGAALVVVAEMLPLAEGGGQSPDGCSEAWLHASSLRRIAALLEPHEWCPPHYYDGQSTNTRGECRLTCQMCGHSFVGNWDQAGLSGRDGGRQ